MNIVATIEMFEALYNVTYYTVRLEIDDIVEEETETDKFLSTFLDEPETPTIEAQDIYNLIEEIGNRGAFKRYFRFENNANALPPKNKYLEELGIDHEVEKELNLRLYCIRLSDNIVILINGGIKTTDSVQDCPNVSQYFRDANKIATLIDEAILEREISIDNHELIFDKDFYLKLS